MRCLGTCARYGETVGSPSYQNRQGISAALLTPTRGPVTMCPERAGWRAPARTRSGESAAHTSAPSSDRSIEIAEVALPRKATG